MSKDQSFSKQFYDDISLNVFHVYCVIIVRSQEQINFNIFWLLYESNKLFGETKLKF